jgi:hypothetical protein
VAQSAQVRCNGAELATLFTPPFQVVLPRLRPEGNTLEIDVTSVSANRIRDLDQRKVPWKTFRDINIVNQAYKPFNAADWPITPAGLIGPVTLQPVKPLAQP